MAFPRRHETTIHALVLLVICTLSSTSSEGNTPAHVWRAPKDPHCLAVGQYTIRGRGGPAGVASATLVTPRIVLTNYHVVERELAGGGPRQNPRIVFPGKEPTEVGAQRIIIGSRLQDWALVLLQREVTDRSPAKLRIATQADIGRTVHVAGYPLPVLPSAALKGISYSLVRQFEASPEIIRALGLDLLQPGPVLGAVKTSWHRNIRRWFANQSEGKYNGNLLVAEGVFQGARRLEDERRSPTGARPPVMMFMFSGFPDGPGSSGGGVFLPESGELVSLNTSGDLREYQGAGVPLRLIERSLRGNIRRLSADDRTLVSEFLHSFPR